MAKGWEQLKGVRDSLNPLNARNNLRSVPSATIFSARGGKEFLSPGLLLLPFFLLSFSPFTAETNPVIHDFLGTPPTAMPPELASSIHKPEGHRGRDSWSIDLRSICLLVLSSYTCFQEDGQVPLGAIYNITEFIGSPKTVTGILCIETAVHMYMLQ